MVLKSHANAVTSTLDSLSRGDVATVARISSELATAKRLADMGFLRGATVTVLRRGRPCIVRVGRTCVGLGLELQRCVIVDRQPG